MRILVRAPNWIGDQVLAFPFFYYLRKAYPKAHIAVACVGWVKSLQYETLVDEIFVLEKPKNKSFVARFMAIDQSARKAQGSPKRSEANTGKWDLGISLPHSFSSAWFLFRAGAQRRRGYAGDGRRFLLNDSIYFNPDPTRHRAQSYLDLLPKSARPERPARNFWEEPAQSEFEDSKKGELSHFDVKKYWPSEKPVAPPEGKYFVVAPGATAESRRWPTERFQVLIEKVYEKTGFLCVLVGGPSEVKTAVQLTSRTDAKIVDYTAKSSVASLSQVFAQSQFTICNESGLAHVAALCGSQVHIICGAANPSRTQPLGPGKVTVKVNPIECWPCEKNICRLPLESKISCLKGISVEAILTEVFHE